MEQMAWTAWGPDGASGWGQNVDYTYLDGMPAVHVVDQGPHSCTPLPH